MDKKSYNALYYAKNRARILAKRKNMERLDAENHKPKSQGFTFLIYVIGIIIVMASVYESYQFYRIDETWEYAAVKALVFELALMGLPFLRGLYPRVKHLGYALILFSGFVMVFSCLKEFCQTSAATVRLPKSIVQLDDQLALDLNRIELYENRGWVTKGSELSQEVKKTMLKKAALEAQLDALGPAWLQGVKLLLQSSYRLLLMIVAWVYVGAIARKQQGEFENLHA